MLTRKLIYVDLDRDKARSFDVPVNQIYQALQSLLAPTMLTHFNKFGRVYQVLTMAQPISRATPSDMSRSTSNRIKAPWYLYNHWSQFKTSLGPTSLADSIRFQQLRSPVQRHLL